MIRAVASAISDAAGVGPGLPRQTEGISETRNVNSYSLIVGDGMFGESFSPPESMIITKAPVIFMAFPISDSMAFESSIKTGICGDVAKNACADSVRWMLSMIPRVMLAMVRRKQSLEVRVRRMRTAR